MNYELNDKIHEEACNAWINSKYIGTIAAVTGIGKTWIAIKSIIIAFEFLNKNNSNPKKIDVLLLAERTNRLDGFLKEVDKYLEIKSIDVRNLSNLKFSTYQSACKLENTHWDLVIADEIHDSLSPKYSLFYYNNTYNSIIGLTATLDREAGYMDSDNTYYTKGDLIDKIAPVVYTYTLTESISNNTSRTINFIAVKTVLDDTVDYIVLDKKRFTEFKAYNYLSNRIKNNMIRGYSDFSLITKRKEIIFNSLDKINAAKAIIKELEKHNVKTLVFGQDLNALEKICETISYKDKNNTKILREKFNSGEILTLGNVKLLKQGENIDNIDVCMFYSYNSKPKDFIQSYGRLRKEGNKLGNVIIFVNENTKENDWYQSMTKGQNFQIHMYENYKALLNSWEKNK
jgi:superfamily II DNA or RNA helicase